jgi:hypothetical protein
MEKTIGLRVSLEQEALGLDFVEHGVILSDEPPIVATIPRPTTQAARRRMSALSGRSDMSYAVPDKPLVTVTSPDADRSLREILYGIAHRSKVNPKANIMKEV